MASNQVPSRGNHPSSVALENEGELQSHVPTTIVTSNVAKTEDGFENQIPTIAVLSSILLVLLICLPIILCRLYRRRPNLSVKRTENNINGIRKVPFEGVKRADDVTEAKHIVDDNVEEASETLGICSSDVNALEECEKHPYESLDECQHVYKNLVLLDETGTEAVDVFEAKCNNNSVCKLSRMSVRLGNASGCISSYHPQTVPAEELKDDDCLAMQATLPSGQDLDHLYVDMSKRTPNYYTIETKRKKRKGIGSFYPEQNRHVHTIKLKK